jgi:hypothetical protein
LNFKNGLLLIIQIKNLCVFYSHLDCVPKAHHQSLLCFQKCDQISSTKANHMKEHQLFDTISFPLHTSP